MPHRCEHSREMQNVNTELKNTRLDIIEPSYAICVLLIRALDVTEPNGHGLVRLQKKKKTIATFRF